MSIRNQAFMYADDVKRHCIALKINLALVVVGLVLMMKFLAQLKKKLMRMVAALRFFVIIVVDTLDMFSMEKGLPRKIPAIV